MKKSNLKLAIFAILAATITVMPSRAFCEEKKPEKADGSPPAAESAKPKSDTGPFRGKVAAIDKAAKTFTVGERTFQVIAETKMMKNSKDCTLDDAAVGDEVGGRFKKLEDGKLVALSVRFGPKPEPPNN